MLFFVSVSAPRLPKIKIEDCDWYRFEGARKVYIENKDFEADIEAKDVFGTCIIKNKIYVLHRDDPDVVFLIDAKTARSLLGRSRPFTGKVKGIKVTGKKANTTAQEKLPTKPKDAPMEARIYEVDNSVGKENKKLTEAIRKAKISGANRLEFLAGVPMPTTETYNYYDATDTYTPFDGKPKDKWEQALEDAVLKVIPRGYIVGAAMIKIDGAMRPCLIIVEK
ncbi:hypothetical protein JA33_121 [Dickeya phage vB_DsoM_JA33]|uniref:KTSC and Metallopeptidase-like N-terminal fusion domain-containing protein n=2 Tax=Salmondvirus JA11 TaxID=2734141 RepID=A0A386K5G8_9CAUD|nr:hypothetical protein HOU32_gp121 [Dickeya phage vB_DsoM_JA11]AXG67495.1 hypothetical protein JA33_121 [Dickeya phage vB_DsoM_JA33]AYD79926.1 hypothetical protein JA11_121 [Dickeya phage vB_DsoM_JA11]